MTDRELLELAAKAVGLSSPRWNEFVEAIEYHHVETPYGAGFRLWNPLTDDGDALRLAVKLEMVLDLYQYEDAVDARVMLNGFAHVGECHSREDPYAATRRAIVMCAAEIGKAMG